ncbi:MAG: ATP-dependent metallopeptidase FtsH/Yme1/Tma family protein [Spirochaetales bacterium]|nr:ATP-dependent metallopeptidase FtsH/Yme1/Tma family protein [Spirochaetales bacterium]
MVKRSGIIRIILFVIVIALIAVLALDTTGVIDLTSLFSNSGKANFIPYSEFTSSVETGKVSEAVIQSGKIIFTTTDGSFVTDNPESPELARWLMEKGVKVTTKTGISVSVMLDVLFDVIFFGAVAFGIFKLIDYSRKTFKVVHRTGVGFSDIAGMDHVKADMMFLVDVLKNPSKYASKGLRPVKGVILEGTPGNGKTLFARALAQEAGVNFIATKGADFQSAMMSMGARKIKMLFNKGKRHRPCIIFIDEFDSIGERRNYAGTGIDKENNRIITTMLNEMDGFTANNGLLVIGATNSYASLDPALVRPGRFDLKYTIGNPDAQIRAKLIEIYTKGKNLATDISPDVLVQAFDGLSCAAIETVLNESQALCQMTGSGAITMDHILGAAHKTGAKLNIRVRK